MSATDHLPRSILYNIEDKLGIKGVQKHWRGSGFTARIGGKYLGLYRTVEEAQAAYERAAAERWGEFARGQ